MSRPAQVKLTGMVTIPRKCVTLEIQMEGKSALPYLAEGESHGSVRILAIDEKSQSVRISNQGMLATLTFSRSSVAPGATSMHVPLQAKPLVNGPAHREIALPGVVAASHW